MAQLEAIERLYRACGKEMLQQGLDNWGESYPPVVQIREDIAEGHLFCLMLGNDLLGVIVLNEAQPRQFEQVNWLYQSKKILVLRRLAIAVQQQGQGYAQKMMRFAEEYAQKYHYGAIRLDAYSINDRLLKFYERLGYQRTKEAIYLEANLDHPFVCFEKKIRVQ